MPSPPAELVHPFDALTEAGLRRRQSAKWKVFPDDVLPAWVAEMDFPIAEPIRRAVQRLTSERRRVLPWFPHVSGADAHAGHTETSLLLAIAPDLVRVDAAEVGRTEHVTDLIGELRAGGVRAVSPNGVLGDPRFANAAHGRSLLTRLTIDLVSAVDEWWE